MRRLIPPLFMLLASLSGGQGQAQPAAATTAAPRQERMALFAGLVGEWWGSGWMIGPDGQRAAFHSREVVTRRLNGAALLVEGRHWAPGQPERTVHEAMAMITWDARASEYRFRSALANGESGDFPVEVSDGSFTWHMNMPGGRIIFTIEHRGGVWRERGRRETPDGRSAEFFEMTLTRQ